MSESERTAHYVEAHQRALQMVVLALVRVTPPSSVDALKEALSNASSNAFNLITDRENEGTMSQEVAAIWQSAFDEMMGLFAATLAP